MNKLIKLILITMFPMQFCDASDINLGWYPSLVVLAEIHDSNLIADKLVLWKSNDVYSKKNESLLLESFSGKPEGQQDSYKQFRLVFMKAEKRFELYEDKRLNAGNGDYLYKVMMPNEINPGYVLYETISDSTGGSGGSDYKTLHVAFLGSASPENHFTFELDWYGQEFNPDDYSYWLSHDNSTSPYLVLQSATEKIIFSISVEHQTVNLESEFTELNIKPSYNCEKVSNMVETVICKDSGLSTLDSLMNNMYKQVKNIEGTSTSQKRWIIYRNECGGLPLKLVSDCIASRYKSRIDELRKKI